VEKFDKNNIPD
jgi:hypothetical protein